MKRALTVAFIAAVAAMLGCDGGAHANPARVIARDIDPITSSDWSDFSGLNITKKLPQPRSFEYHARVKYNDKEGMLVCTTLKFKTERMKHVAKHLSKGINRPGLAIVSADSFPKLEGTMMVKGHYCTLTTWPKSMSLKEYVRNKRPEERDRVLPAIFVQVISALSYLQSMGFIYNYINIESIMIRSNMASEVPEVIVADLHYISGKYGVLKTGEYATIRSGDEPESFENERGYRPPEDYKDSDTLVSKEKVTSWMLGATIYDSLAGMPPYGFTKSLNGTVPWKDAKLKQVMEDLRKFGKNTYPPAETSNNHLATLMKTLLNCDPRARPAISKLNLQLIRELAGGSGVKIAIGFTATDMWSFFKLAVRTVNPFTRN
ncbi:hypothetical protein THASP1DRAFT_32175 [Thamnocephalis sphaerospora]|uniref:Protein kinase domain-containing protein n=1 Tax=Thamnocephalis sphaerospora TaxID=78915 RepID=A0A4P9XJT9_9FUNG|nr:hypothetical protein THASP1DRAFT_32175 [Thamnocephalis sphaerospora]|eukprot:RKP05996.1 hypothetical protein THASP1DRAFT_32175 [Thamnocephalis sphaerospora]